MPTFPAHIPANEFISERKKGLADALDQALHEAMGTPMEDGSIVLAEHREDELFLHPTFPDRTRSDRSIIVAVTTRESRTLEQNRELARPVIRYALERAGVGSDAVPIRLRRVRLRRRGSHSWL